MEHILSEHVGHDCWTRTLQVLELQGVDDCGAEAKDEEPQTLDAEDGERSKPSQQKSTTKDGKPKAKAKGKGKGKSKSSNKPAEEPASKRAKVSVSIKPAEEESVAAAWPAD